MPRFTEHGHSIKSGLPGALLSLFLLAGCSDGSDNLPPTQPPVAPGLQQESVSLASAAQPAQTPGTDGVMVTNPKLITQFGGNDIDLNQAHYTRYFAADQAGNQPDAILILVPGFEGGASNMAILADNLIPRALSDASMVLEVWAMDRRSNPLEDLVGLNIAEDNADPDIGLNFLFGDQLGLELSPELVDGPNRRVITHNAGADLAFMAQWTPLVHSQDIDAIVEQARQTARQGNVFLGGHSAGTGYTARYAATDLNISGSGTAEPGYAKLNGLVLLEGGGGGIADTAPTADTLNRIEAEFDGGLFGAVTAQQARCIDGQTACTVASEAADCAAFSNVSCTEPTDAYADSSLTPTELFAAAELVAIDAEANGDSGLSILQQDQGSPGNNAVEQVPELIGISILLGGNPGTSASLLGQFIDDDGLAAATAPFLATSVGAVGPIVDGVDTWLGTGENIPASAFDDNGPAPQSPARAGVWGVEAEPTDLKGRLMPFIYAGATNFFDWYYPSSGLGIASELGLDTSALSAPPPLGRGRSDIANRTQAANINIPVIAFGGSNGLTPTPGTFSSFARSIGMCTAPACDGVTPRLLDEAQPSLAFPSFGDISGGYEVYMSEGYAHLDILTADDGADNNVIGPLVDFMQRHTR